VPNKAGYSKFPILPQTKHYPPGYEPLLSSSILLGCAMMERRFILQTKNHATWRELKIIGCII